MSNIELKPCPFCGGQVEITHHSFGTTTVLLCPNCRTMFLFPWSKTPSAFDIKQVWNRRAE